jgi:hypothetical protein
LVSWDARVFSVCEGVHECLEAIGKTGVDLEA